MRQSKNTYSRSQTSPLLTSSARQRKTAYVRLAISTSRCFFSGSATKTTGFERRLELAVSPEELLKRPVEVIDSEMVPPFLQHQIRKSGKLIVDKDPQRRKACEVASRRLYLDMLPYLRYRREKVLERLG